MNQHNSYNVTYIIYLIVDLPYVYLDTSKTQNGRCIAVTINYSSNGAIHFRGGTEVMKIDENVCHFAICFLLAQTTQNEIGRRFGQFLPHSLTFWTSWAVFEVFNPYNSETAQPIYQQLKIRWKVIRRNRPTNFGAVAYPPKKLMHHLAGRRWFSAVFRGF